MSLPRPLSSRTLAKVTAVAVTILLIPLAPPASASDDNRQIHTAVLPVGSELPSLEDLQHGGAGLPRLSAEDGFGGTQAPAEVLGPAASHGLVSTEASALAEQASYPAPARTLTPQECIRGLGTDKKFFIKSRYAACSGAVFFSVWTKNNRPVGETQFVYLSIGTIAKDSREVRMTQYFTEMKKVGDVTTSALMIKPAVAVSKVWPATAKVTQTGAVPGARSFDTLAAQQSKGFTRILNAAPGQGPKPDDAVFSAFEASATVTPPPGYKPTGELSGKLFFLPPRWDKATYLKVAQGAAVFSYAVPLVYSTKAGAPEKAVADHIKAAFTQPGTTKPTNAGKKVPGHSASAPLHRLYHASARRKKNRSTAVSTCKKEFGANYGQGGKECDEYPFAVTYEGCALPSYDSTAPKNNFSVRALPKADNGNAGNLLGQFLTLNRIIDGKDDGFYVTIT